MIGVEDFKRALEQIENIKEYYCNNIQPGQDYVKYNAQDGNANDVELLTKIIGGSGILVSEGYSDEKNINKGNASFRNAQKGAGGIRDYAWLQFNDSPSLSYFVRINREEKYFIVTYEINLNENKHKEMKNEYLNRIAEIEKILGDEKIIKGENGLYIELFNSKKITIDSIDEKKWDDFKKEVCSNYVKIKLIDIAINATTDSWEIKTATEMLTKLLEKLDDVGPIEESIFEQICSGSKQIILTGAPGTGKTFSAKRFVNIVNSFKEGNTDKTWEDNNNQFVQFHSSYDYTDFVEGLRPARKGGENTFVRMDGTFMSFCRKACSDKDNNHFFIIDEINRADLPKVFGELMYSLEESYRNKAIKTQYYSMQTYIEKKDKNDKDNTVTEIKTHEFDDGFYIPNNVYIIGTMNEIDHSVDSFDYALRRRFKWVNVEVNTRLLKSAFDGMNKKAKCKKNEEYIAKLIENVSNINDKIADYKKILNPPKDYYIGPAYFSGVFDGESDVNIFNNKVAPLLKEYIRGRETQDGDLLHDVNCQWLDGNISLEWADKKNNKVWDNKLGNESEFGYVAKIVINEICNGSRQIVLTGAPGTGKTYAVRQFVENIYKDSADPWKKDNCFVQFHPSFDYSDFVEGLKPAEINGKSTFVRMEGIFKKFCREVIKENTIKRKDDENALLTPHFFVIDEINRADLGRVFGELMFSLEESHRNEGIPTQYSNLIIHELDEKSKQLNSIDEDEIFGNGFYIPDNIIIIGTMNDIDRSVDTFDFALRRRFKWISVDVVDKYLDEVLNEMKNAFHANVNIENCKKIINCIDGVMNDYSKVFKPAKDYYIGPAYFKGYFKGEDLENIYIHKVRPLLKEYLRGRREEEEFIKICDKKVNDIIYKK